MSTLNGWERLPTSECVAFRKVLCPEYRLAISGLAREDKIALHGYFGGLDGRGNSIHLLALLTPEQVTELKQLCLAEYGQLPVFYHDGRPV